MSEHEDTHRGRFLDSDVPAPEQPHFEALGRSGSDHYVGLETFPNPGCAQVAYTSDEVVACCPITGQPDYYTVRLVLSDTEKCIESKSLKLFYNNLQRQSFVIGTGVFCESLAVYLRDQVMEALGEDDPRKVTVDLMQKSRGGISIQAVA